MTQVCLSCGADNRDTAKFCKACGTALLPQAEARPFESSAWPDLGVVAAVPARLPFEAAPGDEFAATQFHAHRWGGDPAPAQSFAPATEPTTTPPPAAAFHAPAAPEPEPWFLPGDAGAGAAPLAAGVPLPRPFGLPGSSSATPASTSLLGGSRAPAAATDAPGAGGVAAAAATATNWPAVAAAAAVALVVVSVAAWVAWGWGGFGDKAEPRPIATAVKKKTAPPVAAEVTPGALTAAAPTAAGPLSSPQPPPSSLTPSNTIDVSAPPALAPTAPAPPTAAPAPTTSSALSRPSDARLAAAKPAAKISLGGSASSSPLTPTHAGEPVGMASPSPAPVTPVMVLPSGPASPQEACSAAGMFGRSACLHEQCAKPAFATHAQCRRWRLERQQEEQQRLYGGS
jgi:hypothetical protein